MRFKIALPCEASQLESFIHRCCDTNGFNCTVTSDGSSLIFEYHDPSIIPQPTTENMRWKC